MLSNHLQNGIEAPKISWSRLQSSEGGVEPDAVGLMKKRDDGGVESLDYEVIENYAYWDEQAQRGKLYVGYHVIVKWFFALLIGIGWKFALTFAIIQKSYVAGFVVYILINLILVFSSVYIVTQFAPAAAGSGIPEIKGYLNGVDIHGVLLFRTLVGKIFGSIGSVGGGLALGKEGPLVHTGACIASLLGQLLECAGNCLHILVTIIFVSFLKYILMIRPGVSAAFRAPVGGVLFALEEVTSWWKSQLMWRIFFTSAVVAVVVRTAMGWCKSGKCGHFGSGGFIIWDLSDGQEDYSFEEFLPMAVIGVIGALLGMVFIVLAIPCPEADADSGIECPRPPGTYGNYVNFYCSKDKEYNDLATIFFNTQDDAIRNLFSAKTFHEYSAQSLLTFLSLVDYLCNFFPNAFEVMFYSLAVVTFGTAVPAGQFVPGIMIGSTYGRLVGMFVVNFYKKLSIEEGTYALLGAASFLGGSMRMTVSLCVIMVEIANNLKLLPLIMLVLLISKAVGDAFNEGLYEEQARLKSIPLLESRPKYQMRKMPAKEASGKRVISFPRVVKVADLVSILRSNNHNGFPVIDHARSGETLVIGLMLRSHLLVLLQSKVDFQHSPLPCDPRGARHTISEFVKPASSKGLLISDIHLSSDDLEMYIDLAPFLNPSPYIVPEDMSLTKVIGLITRKDLLLGENEDSALMELQSTSLRKILSLVQYFVACSRSKQLCY
ncbi:hypothetical protein C1H46_036780 [Malus baccata]|uniref:Chloride channel protein n=1 Tax=Malus baccata TaxID=106549 RepID=A0A540KU79_MALBA|nr:hypothetical protein C1H46_036780 [Malus baccata]